MVDLLKMFQLSIRISYAYRIRQSVAKAWKSLLTEPTLIAMWSADSAIFFQETFGLLCEFSNWKTWSWRRWWRQQQSVRANTGTSWRRQFPMAQRSLSTNCWNGPDNSNPPLRASKSDRFHTTIVTKTNLMHLVRQFTNYNPTYFANKNILQKLWIIIF